jgi:ribosomal protein S18 acetylase RimI-like enzyme
MIEINPLQLPFDYERFLEIASGYVTNEIYRVEWNDSEAVTTFSLELHELSNPRAIRFEFDDDEMTAFRDSIPNRLCLGAFDGSRWVAAALAKPHAWNSTLWVAEFHIDEAYRGKGIGRRMMSMLIESAREAGLRAVVCEAQHTNIPAIRFYRALGFRLEGIDVSLYTNDDLQPDGSVALMMKLRIT